MKTILLTGCAGFIGSHVCEKLLHNGFHVIGVDNFDNFYSKEIKVKNLQNSLSQTNFDFYEIDITDKEALFSIDSKIDLVIHLAAKAGVQPSFDDPLAYIKTNIEGTNNVLEMMLKNRINKLVFASSSSVYGNNNKIPFEETDLVEEPISPYAFTKRACELMNYNYHKIYGLDIVNLRFFTVYGPRQRPDLAIHKFFNLINEHKPIQMYGDGESARDYTYIEDTLGGIINAVDFISKRENVYEIFNLGNNSPITLNNLIAAVFNVFDKKENIDKMPMQPGDVNVTYASIEKAKRTLNYNPKTSLNEGLIKFKMWFDEK